MVIRASKRKKLKKSQFGMPGSRKYPVDTKKRAANAKARSTQAWKKGRISKSTRDKIHAKANKRLRKGK